MSAICGIVGAGAAEPKGTRDLALMMEMLKTRGPDGIRAFQEVKHVLISDPAR